MKTQKIVIKYGIFTAVILIAYFLFLSILGLSPNPVYSFVNAVICAVGISLSIKDFKERNPDSFHYKDGFITGFSTGICATIIFTIFFITYFSYDQAFADALLKNLGNNIDTGLMFFAVMVMGITSSMVVTLVLMQHYKRVWHTSH